MPIFSGGKEVPGKIVTFSGYPAALQSDDDFTLTSAGLVSPDANFNKKYFCSQLSLETTIDVFDYQLYWTRVKSRQQLHCWLRAYIANQLTASSHDWVKLFARLDRKFMAFGKPKICLRFSATTQAHTTTSGWSAFGFVYCP